MSCCFTWMGAALSRGSARRRGKGGLADEEDGLENVVPSNAHQRETTREDLERKHDELKRQYAENLQATLNAKPVVLLRRVSAGSGSGICLSMLPHEHSLFCERKERVCKSVGKLQEHERLRVKSSNPLVDLESPDVTLVWLRSPPLLGQKEGTDMDNDGAVIEGGELALFRPIEGTQGKLEYELSAEDVDCYISVRAFKTTTTSSSSSPTTTSSSSVVVTVGDGVGEGGTDEDAVVSLGVDTTSNASTTCTTFEAEAAIGPVLAGPPRLLDLSITGDAKVGSTVKASIQYIGGQPGASEFWWMRIRNGEREQISEPTPALSSSSSDPRLYTIQPTDAGCVLKVKCRPVRSDGHKGEIFTSKPSEKIV